MGPGLVPTVVLVADGGPDQGLGHLSRCGAVGAALKVHGIPIQTFVNGGGVGVHDGLDWTPLSEEAIARIRAANAWVVHDSYELDPAELAPPERRVLLAEGAGATPAALVVDVAGATGRSNTLTGLRHACLRSSFWGLPPRAPGDAVREVLVTAGGGPLASAVDELIETVRTVLPDARIEAVRGPYATVQGDAGRRSDSLVEPLLRADLAVGAGGQTMLEAVATGTPYVALVLAENQRAQVERLVAAGVIRASPAGSSDLAGAIGEIARDGDSRARMIRDGQALIDGYGALRVAFRICRLLRRAR